MSANVDPRVVRLVTGLAAAVAILLSVALPASYFWNARAREVGRIEAEAKIAAANLSALVARNPEMWRFEGHRIEGMLDGHPEEAWRVVAQDGEVIAELTPSGFAPWLPQWVQVQVYDASFPVASVEIAWSLETLLRQTSRMAVFSVLTAFLAFMALRVAPMRLLRQALERAAYLAQHDPLTGLPNRVLFQDRLDQAIRRARRDNTTVAVLCLDLDYFKDVNDTLGHSAGDSLLIAVVQRVTATLREEDTLARLGGDEFAIVLSGQIEPAAVEVLAKRVVAALSTPFQLGDHQALIGVSIGIAMRSGGGADSTEVLLQEADTALYKAKNDGRGGYCFFEAAMNRKLRERRAMEVDLRNALATGGFKLHFQPQVDLVGRHLLGAEALIRWHHPERGQVPPDQFVPLAEETGMIVPIGRWVLREACREAARWPGHLRIAVNVSPAQFRASDFVQQVMQALGESGMAPGRLELEVTEGVLLKDTADTLVTLRNLRALGVTIAMDDFGTGYSSLGYLRKFQFDKIKIDRSFVQRLNGSIDAMPIIRAVLGMSRALGIRSNAEGVENEGQAEMLRAEGCEEVQGYLFGRPMAAEEFRALLVEECPRRNVA